jgi:hypothetical protein
MECFEQNMLKKNGGQCPIFIVEISLSWYGEKLNLSGDLQFHDISRKNIYGNEK